MIGERLAQARRRAGLAQVELAVALGDRYNQQMISMVETGKGNLLLDGAINAARELGVSLDYLTGLTDDPTPPASGYTPNRSVAEMEERYDVDPGETIDQLNEVAAAAGSGGVVYDETVTARVPFRRQWLRRHRINPRHCHIISVRGDSMDPTLPNGSQVIVDRNRKELRPGRIYVMRTEEGLVVKRVKRNAQGWWLMSDNPAWAPLLLNEETDIIGEVRWYAVTL